MATGGKEQLIVSQASPDLCTLREVEGASPVRNRRVLLNLKCGGAEVRDDLLCDYIRGRLSPRVAAAVAARFFPADAWATQAPAAAPKIDAKLMTRSQKKRSPSSWT